MSNLNKKIEEFKNFKFKADFNDFLLTWEHDLRSLKAIVLLAEVLKEMQAEGLSYKIFESGLGVSIFKDNSTRTRFSFSSAVDSLGLSIQEFDEEKSQIAHGESVKETANMISFLTEVIGIRDDKYIGEGDRFQRMVSEAVDFGYEKKILKQRPAVINLQSDLDHPTQSLSDLAKIKEEFGSFEEIKGKKIAVSWAYSPSYGKPLSVSQGVIGLLSRFGADITLAHPEEYDLSNELVEMSQKQAEESGGSFKTTNKMNQAFEGADIVYPKSWAPIEIMKKKTKCLKSGDLERVKALEKDTLRMNERYNNWECNRERMKLTNDALYMHPLPADISGENCRQGEVSKAVFKDNLIHTYQQASFKPFIITAMIIMSKVKDSSELIGKIASNAEKRRHF